MYNYACPTNYRPVGFFIDEILRFVCFSCFSWIFVFAKNQDSRVYFFTDCHVQP